MTVETHIRIADPVGRHLITIPSGFVLDYIINVAPGAIGVLELTISPAVDPALLYPDGQVRVMRSIDGNLAYLDNGAVYLIETFEFTAQQTFIRAFHMNTLAARRYVLYGNGSTFANKAATFADNLVKTYWKENVGASIDASREGTQTQADLSAYITVDANLSLGASIAMAAANEPLVNVLQRICEASNTAGTYLTYEIISDGSNGFFFKTYTTSRGLDRRYGTTNALILDERRGNLAEAKVLLDYHNQITAAVALGATAVTGSRYFGSAIDSLIALGPFHRIEGIINNSNVFTQSILDDNADALVRNARPLISITGKLIDTPQCTRGIHYDLGDMLSVRVPNGQTLLDVRLDLVHEHIDATGSGSSQDLTSHQVAHRYATGGLRSI